MSTIAVVAIGVVAGIVIGVVLATVAILGYVAWHLLK